MHLTDTRISDFTFCGPIIVAHRGASVVAPENTLSSIQKAIEAGAGFVEIDIRLSKDGVPFVIHDETLDRTTRATGRVEDFTRSELEKIKASYPSRFGELYADEKLPTLFEVLDFSRGKIKLCLELKTEGLELPVIELVEYFGITNEVIIISSQSERLRKVKRLNKDIKVLFLQECVNAWSVLKAFKNGFDIIGSSKCVHERLIKFAHLYDIKMFRFAYSDPNELSEIIFSGIDGIVTGDPDTCQSLKAGEPHYLSR